MLKVSEFDYLTVTVMKLYHHVGVMFWFMFPVKSPFETVPQHDLLEIHNSSLMILLFQAVPTFTHYTF